MKQVKLFIITGILFCNLFAKTQTQVKFYTTMGDFVVELREDLVPITAGNFIGLVQKKFYDGIIFHRVIDGFMIQGGDPLGTGYGGSGVKIKDEFTPSLSNVQTSISMANSGPNTGTSQFFINLVDNKYLDNKHAVFGKVIMNFSVVQAIGKVPVNKSDNKPLTPVVMDSIRVITTLGISQNNSNIHHISFQPNPVTEQSVLNIAIDKAEELNITVYDHLGRIVASKTDLMLTEGIQFVPFNTISQQNLSAGIYMVNIYGNAGYSNVLKVVVE